MRLDRVIQPKRCDPYDMGRKYSEGMYCPECQALYRHGRWQWPQEGDVQGEPHLCSACRRIRERFPAGEILITGQYLSRHMREIVNLIQNIVRDEKQRSPLKRVIDFTQDNGALRVSFTDDHLARRIGEAIRKAYKGDLDVKYSEGERFVRLYWSRDR